MEQANFGSGINSGIGVFAQQERGGSMLFGGTRQYDGSYDEQGLSSAGNVAFFAHSTRDDGLDPPNGYEGYRGMGGNDRDDGLTSANDGSLRVLGGAGGYPTKLGISATGGGGGGFSMLDQYSLESSMSAEIDRYGIGIGEGDSRGDRSNYTMEGSGYEHGNFFAQSHNSQSSFPYNNNGNRQSSGVPGQGQGYYSGFNSSVEHRQPLHQHQHMHDSRNTFSGLGLSYGQSQNPRGNGPGLQHQGYHKSMSSHQSISTTGSGGSDVYVPTHGQTRSDNRAPPQLGQGGSNAQGRAINKMLLEILRDRTVDPNRLTMAVDANIERMDCVNLATLLFHTGKKRLLLSPSIVQRVSQRFNSLKEELRAREASNALYGLKCMSSDTVEVRQLIFALANKVTMSTTELVAQAVGNALYGCQMMTSEHEEVRFLLEVLAVKVSRCTELLEAQNVGNALYGLRGMNSDFKEVRAVLAALIPKVATAREDLNGQALGNSLYGLQNMSSKESEVREMLVVLSGKILRIWEELKAQEVGNSLYGLRRMRSDCPEVIMLLEALVPKIHSSPDILDATAIGNSFFGLQSMQCECDAVRYLLDTMADKVTISITELDGHAIGNSLFGLQGMQSEHIEVCRVVSALASKIMASSMNMNDQELANAFYGLKSMSSNQQEVRRLLVALEKKAAASNHDMTNHEISAAVSGLRRMSSECNEVRALLHTLALKIHKSQAFMDPPAIAHTLYGIQKMSSECEEVRSMVVAVISKIEQSWKLWNGQSISIAMYGMQKLSSAEAEVRKLVSVMTSKLVAFRDEMTAIQICVSLHGLQSMSCGTEVSELIGVLAEKVKICSESLLLPDYFGGCLFGLQNLTSDDANVVALVKAIATNISTKPAPTNSMTLESFSNAVFGLQRMSTSNEHVGELVQHLAGLYKAGFAETASASNAVAYSNIIYGLQNCSCLHQGTKDLVVAVTTDIDALLQHPNLAALHEMMPTTDLLAIHQSLSLSFMIMSDSESCPQVVKKFEQMITITTDLLQTRKGLRDLRLQSLTIPEARLSATIQVILANEPLTLTCGDLLYGFECAAVVSISPELKLAKADGTSWAPFLNIEVEGTRNARPVRAHFDELRRRYLTEKHGVHIESIPAEAFNVAPGFQRNLLRIHPTLLSCFRAATEEDRTAIDASLRTSSASASATPGGLLSTVDEQATLIMAHAAHPHLKAMTQISNADMYVDDNLENSGVTSNMGSNFAPRGVKVNYGMYVGWAGIPLKYDITVTNVPGMHLRLTNKTAVQTMTPTMPPQPPLRVPLTSASAAPSPYEIDHARMHHMPTNASQHYYHNSQKSPAHQAQLSAYASQSDALGETNDNDESSQSSRSTQSQSNAVPPGGEVDIEIALLERQLEIARMESKLLELKKVKMETKKPMAE